MTRVSEAVVLMAGSGSRLCGSDETFLKPLVPVCGRPLISYTLDALAKAGIKKVNFVVGYQSARMTATVMQLVPAELEFRFVENLDWQKQNGISLLTAATHVAAPFVLSMCDHLFDKAIVDLLIQSSDPGVLNLAVDRKLHSIFDLDDAMKVQARGNQIVAIGKTLQDYNAIDTGLFVCPPEIFAYLERAKRDGDCSLADGVRLMAAEGKARVIDIGAAWWQDIDTPDMLEHVESEMRALKEPRIGRV